MLLIILSLNDILVVILGSNGDVFILKVDLVLFWISPFGLSINTSTFSYFKLQITHKAWFM